MAWHDDKWNGRVCKDPESSIYCIGTHSLLSERLARNKNTDIEKQKLGEKIEKIKGYLPPCFWSADAFSPEAVHVTHVHPFRS
jgi:exodeoxyribonuclease V alpha subunit